MSGLKVDISWESADDITAANLKSCYESLVEDYDKRKKDIGICIFERDKEADLKILSEHCEAFKIVLKYYGVEL